jgi:hypothetical protein
MPAIPFWQPLLLLGNPIPARLETLSYLLGNPSFVSWRESLSTLDPGWLYTEPPSPPIPPFPLPTVPLVQMHALSRRRYDIGFT